MIANTILSVGAAMLAVGANAQSAPGFPVPVTQNLQVFWGFNTVSPPGELIPRPEIAQPPVLTFFSPSPKRGVVLLVDSDVPRNGTRVQLLHWLATNLTHSANSSVLTVPAGAPVPYLQPSPPVGDSPHSYTFLLFEEPANFSIPASYGDLAANRVNFNVSKFVADTGLGAPLAGNWITVQNLTGSATTTFPAARPTATSNATTSASASSPAVFTGKAGGMQVGGVFWAGVGTAVMAGVAAFAL